MHYARYQTEDGTRYVAVTDWGPPVVGQPLPAAPWTEQGSTAATRGLPPSIELDEDRCCCPLVPSKIIGIGRNYAAHAKELGNELPASPLMFFKPPSSLLASGGTVELPSTSERVDFEAELGVVIGKRCRRVSRAEADAYVFGFTTLCDVTARDLQRRDGQWTRAKGFDTFCPAGPTLVSKADVEWGALSIRLWQNGQLVQDGNTRDMVFDVPTLIEEISRVMTLEPGDVIATGTPPGVGPLAAGDRIEIQIADWPRLRFGVAAAA